MKKILYLVVISLLINGFTSCNNDDEFNKRSTNFDVPELTVANTIQFTVTTKANDYAYVILKGGKIAVEWGDGEITKDVNPEKGESWQMEFTHVYKKAGEYRVKIWSDEVSFINVSSLLKNYEQLHIGNCPELKEAVLNSFSKDKTVNLNGCTNLETLNLGNWEQLESVPLDKCSELNDIMIYTNPQLKSLDLSKNSKLRTLQCQDSGIEELKLPANIVNVNCQGNNLKSIDFENYKELREFNCSRNENLTSLNLTGCEKLDIIGFSNTQIESFDFSKFPGLTMVDCSNSKMTGVDVSKCKNLGNLHCRNLSLTSLDITNNTTLSVLDCGNNDLSVLDVSKNTYFRYLYVNDNRFEKEQLEAIFNALPKFNPASGKSTPPAPQPSEMKIFNNPGTSTCDTKIITNKGWVIKND